MERGADGQDETEVREDAKPVAEPDNSSTSDTEGPGAITPPEPKAPKRNRKPLIIAIAAIILLLGAGAAWYFLLNKKETSRSTANTSKNNTAVEEETATADPQLAKFANPTTGETWLAERQKVGNLGYLADSNPDYVDYYEVGKRDSNVIYMSDSHDGPGNYLMLYEKATDGKVRAITHADANVSYDPKRDEADRVAVASSVAIDTTIHYDSLSVPDSFAVGNSEIVKTQRSGSLQLGSPKLASGSSVKRTVLKKYGDSTLIKVEVAYADTHLTAINYMLDLPIQTELTLSYKPIGLNVSEYTWDNGVAIPKEEISEEILASSPDYLPASMGMSGIIRGCGVRQAVGRADAVQDSDFVAAGKTADGKAVYAFKDGNNVLVQKSYEEYVDYNSYEGAPKTVSHEDFLKQHAVIAYKSPNNGWLIYTRDAFAAVGGCAKPVVYLYPTQTQQVKVRVGADVTVSDPLYNPATGWTAFARPDGTLTVNGKMYDSLFWEGQGSGLYPGITSGTVVKRADAAAAIARQLQQQGLNSKETADFLAYWTPKIPNNPYIRLTWFNTAEMDQLAPLHITPKPDTVIRVFLDMSGYDYPVQLPAQKLSATPRSGFTVVEWGGLSGTALQ